ncbi:hypothetical protein Hamer_G032138, partial [Homarus americanus]
MIQSHNELSQNCVDHVGKNCGLKLSPTFTGFPTAGASFTPTYNNYWQMKLEDPFTSDELEQLVELQDGKQKMKTAEEMRSRKHRPSLLLRCLSACHRPNLPGILQQEAEKLPDTSQQQGIKLRHLPQQQRRSTCPHPSKKMQTLTHHTHPD